MWYNIPMKIFHYFLITILVIVVVFLIAKILGVFEGTKLQPLPKIEKVLPEPIYDNLGKG